MILSSPDGTLWTRRFAPRYTAFRVLGYGNGVFVLDVGFGVYVVSSDGANWSVHTNGPLQAFRTIGFGNGQFISVSGQNVFTSIDATNWTARGSVTFPGRRAIEITYGNGHFLAVGEGNPEYSRDGNLWTQSAANLPARAAVFADGFFYIVTSTGIWQSDPVADLTFAGLDRLSIAGPTNRTYQIESRDDLAAASGWRSVTNLTLSASPQSWTDPRPAAAQRFYRALLLP